MQLTDDQKAAAAAFTAFMVSNDKEMVISGPAGVGKSTLLKHLMNSQDHVKIQGLLGVDPIENWELTATTNKAAEVLQRSAGKPAKTVHSLLGIQVSTDFNTGRQTLKRKPTSPILSNSLLVIDECSMIDRDLDRLIDESTINCKILFVGDHCQMAPVMEDLSPVFMRNEPVELRQIVRSQGTPPITDLCNQLRRTVETGVFHPIIGVPGIIDYLDPEEVQAELRHYFVDNPETLGHASRILAYRNQQVIQFNDWIRTERGMPRELTQDEWVISNNSTHFVEGGSQRLRVEQEVKIYSIGEIEDFIIKGTRNSTEKIQVRRADTSGGMVWIPVDREHAEALLKYYSKNKDWESFYRIKEWIADLRPRDACTVYKAQGSTYETVFVDLKDIGRCPNAKQVARMLYVACSRPTHRICFIGKLPDRFLGC